MKKKNNVPYSNNAERSVLCGLFIDNNKWDDVNLFINSKDFYFVSNKVIFESMDKLIKLNKPIDIIMVSEILSQLDLLDDIGGMDYLIKINNKIINIDNILIYAQIIKDYSNNRRLISISKEIITHVNDNFSMKSSDLLNYAESKIIDFNVSVEEVFKDSNDISILVDNVINDLSLKKDSPKKTLTGLDTGFRELNNKTLGIQKSELIIIAARPSIGKTTFMLNLCENISFLYEKPVLIFSLEMNSEQIIMKIFSSLTNIDLRKIRIGNLNNDEWDKIIFIKDKIKKKKNIFIDDSSKLTPNELRNKSKKLYKQYGGLSLIVIDYLQLMTADNIIGNRNLEVSEISKSLKSLAKELNVPVIALSQLNRSLEQRINKRPINSDLRDSGTIEQDADLILFLHKEDFINNKLNYENYELIIGKQRNGPIGIINILFNNKCSKFYDLNKNK